MPDDPNRRYHEERLESVVREWVQYLEAEAVALVAHGTFTFQTIPAAYWSTVRQRLRDDIVPYVYEIQYLAAQRMTSELGFGEVGAMLMSHLENSSLALADTLARETVDRIKHKTSEAIEQAENSGVALVVILQQMLTSNSPREMSIRITTNSITDGERITAHRMGDYLDKFYQHETPAETVAQPAGQGASPSADLPAWGGRQREPLPRGEDDTTVVTPSPAAASGGGESPVSPGRSPVVLVATWNTQSDERVCPICQPLDGIPDYLWPDEYARGPQAHPNCRCYLTWGLESRDSLPIGYG